MKRWENTDWTSKMTLAIDSSCAMEDAMGSGGLAAGELDALAPRLDAILRGFLAKADAGEYGFAALPSDHASARAAIGLGERIERDFDDLVLLGIGGSALGPRALLSALGHPMHNIVDRSIRGHGVRLHVMENVDPVTFASVMGSVPLNKTAFLVVTKSGSTVETMSQFMIARHKLVERFGFDGYRERMFALTDPAKGTLRRIANAEGLVTLPVPANIGGRFSVLCPVGMVPAAAVGLDVEEIMAGAAFMEKSIRTSTGLGNPASLFAAICWLADTAKKRNMLVMMPYADALLDFAEWFQQLWAESLGKKTTLDGKPAGTGSTVVRALGVTDQHSQLQMYVEGPQDKLVVFLNVDRFGCEVEIPKDLENEKDLAYLGGNTLNRLLAYEQEGTTQSLLAAGRPSIKVSFPEINAFTVGQFIMLCEFATVIAGGLYNVNPFDQPGVEHGKNVMYKRLGKPGY